MVTSMKTLLSWTCYWIGDAISRTIEPLFGRWFVWPYRIYNWFVLRSVDLQEDNSRGPWSEPEA